MRKQKVNQKRKSSSPKALVPAKLPAWMVLLAKEVGHRRTPREGIGEVLERLAGAALRNEHKQLMKSVEV